MQFDVNVNLAASPELLAAINNLAAAFAAENTITRAARKTPAAKKEEAPASTAEAPGKSVSSVAPPPSTNTLPYSSQETAGSATNASPSDKKPTVVEVRAALAALVKTNREKAIALLAKYGAASVSALKEEHYSAVLEEAKQ